jgi:hypothetical protein
MNEEQAYDKLQEILALCSELVESGHYSPDDLILEINGQLR